MDKYRIDSHKLLWHLDRVLEWQKDRTIVPVYLEVSPVSYCNHNCIFCGIDFARVEKFELKSDLFCSRLEEMGRLGVRSIMFAGEGEPLLHKDLPKFVRVGKDAGIDISITTNGTLGNYSVWEAILLFLTWIRFSVDAGTPEVHAKVHNVSPKLFPKTVKSIEEAVSVKRKMNLNVTIGVQFLIIDENISDIETAMALFSEIGVDYFSLKPYSLHPQMIRKMDTLYSDEVVRHIDEVVDKYRKTSDMNIIFRREALRKYMEGDKKYHHCRALPFWGYISSRGDFYTCSVFIGDERFKAGNIYESNMKQIFAGDKRRDSIDFGEKVLLIADECRLNCRMARINEFLEMLGNSPRHINFI